MSSRRRSMVVHAYLWARRIGSRRRFFSESYIDVKRRGLGTEWIGFFRHRETFIQTLDVTKILPSLLTSRLLTPRDEHDILSDGRRRQRATKVMDLIEAKGSTALTAFQDAIEDYYPHLYMLLTETDEEEEEEYMCYKGDAWKPLREARQYLLLELDAANLVSRLRTHHILDKDESAQITEEKDLRRRNEIFLDIMQSREPWLVATFLEIVGEVYPHVYLVLTGQGDDLASI